MELGFSSLYLYLYCNIMGCCMRRGSMVEIGGSGVRVEAGLLGGIDCQYGMFFEYGTYYTSKNSAAAK